MNGDNPHARLGYPARVLILGECGQAAARLGQEGYEVLRAPGSVRALGLARELLPAVILVGTDAASDGVKLVGELSTEATTRFVPVFLLVPEPRSETVRMGLEAGAWAVLAVDIEPDELTVRVDTAVGRKLAYEQRVAEKQRVTLLELAGAVAHRLNQPLTSMSVIVETLIAAQRRGDLPPERLHGRLVELLSLVERMAELVRQVGNVVEYRTTRYVGDVRIIDLDSKPDSLGR